MSNKNKQNNQSSANKEREDRADKTKNTKSEDYLENWQKRLSNREKELNEREMELSKQELEAQNGFPKLFEEKFADAISQLKERELEITVTWKKIEADKEKLRQRELTIQNAEILKAKGYQDERKKLDDELKEKRESFDAELAEKRENRFSDLENEIESARNKRLQLLTDEIDEKRSEFQNEIAQLKKDLDDKKTELKEREIAVEDLELEKKKTLRKQERLEEETESFEEKIEKGIEERKRSFEKEETRLNTEAERLRDGLKISNDLISNFKELKQKLGDEEPAAVLLKLKTYEEEIKTLREDLATRPTQEMQEAFDRLKSEKDNLQLACERLSEDNAALRSSARTQSDLEMQIAELSDKNKSLLRRFESVDAENTRLNDELERYNSGYQKGEEVEKRIKRIKQPLNEIPIKERESDDNIVEIQWLNGIQDKFNLVGFSFPSRILKAFHTSLKTAEWSPITVLAGVSGTGKSKLPELYAQFGGLNFLNTPVQPNWDSMESMLGFYNSIDNYFDAQPVLRFLAQSQLSPSEQYPNGLSDVMNLVLLDEMNLAHIELYFADFLSKLEERRGKKTVPNISVKIGAKQDPYLIPMGRNVLWVGTMNQDETTKTLSDKVLDRGVVINFPRPERLERMKKLSDPSSHAAKLITKKQWGSWWAEKSSFNDDQITPYKLFVEEMNTSLSKVGRALGHRVWQSIEYYMSNYPDVLEAQRNPNDDKLARAMKVAFEDQLVQKIMPKLRGIETRGKSKTDCLDKIRTQLVDDDYAIVEDFDLACEFGYGQFIWNSANYLKDDDPGIDLETTES